MKRRFRTDATWRRFGRTILAGSPLRLFTTSEGAAVVIDPIERGEPIVTKRRRNKRLIDRLLDAGAIHPLLEHRSTVRSITVITPQLGGTVRDDGRITVDDGSQPPLEGASARLDPNRGPAAARNVGRSLAESELLAFLDADVVAPVDWYAPLLEHFDDPKVGLVAPRVEGDAALDLGDAPARVRWGTRVSYVPAAAVVIRADAFDAIGGFDETLRVGEDVDLVWRLDEAGWTCRYEPTVSVRHRPRPDWRSRARQIVSYGCSAASLSLRHPRALAPARFNGWSAATWALVVAGQPIAAIILAAGSAIALVPTLPALPPAEAVRLAVRGHVAAGRQLLDATRRAWWPAIVVAAVVSPRVRAFALVAALAAGRPAQLADDLVYGWGVWRGVFARRTARPLLPQINAFPAPRPRRRAALRSAT